MWWQNVWENHSRGTIISSSVDSLSGKISQVEQVPLIRRQFLWENHSSWTSSLDKETHCLRKSLMWKQVPWQRDSLDPFQNLNNKSGRDFTRKILQHMVLWANWQKQPNSHRQSSENVYIQKLHILGSHKQNVNSEEWEPLRDSKVNIGV